MKHVISNILYFDNIDFTKVEKIHSSLGLNVWLTKSILGVTIMSNIFSDPSDSLFAQQQSNFNGENLPWWQRYNQSRLNITKKILNILCISFVIFVPEYLVPSVPKYYVASDL